MHRLIKDFRPTLSSMLGGVLMTFGALVYLHDQLPKPRNWHVMLWPALVLMGLGVILAAVGTLNADD